MDRNAVRISACYIVKDEEENIVRSIASLRDGVDEVIVVDTGSTDGTIEVMKTLEREIGCSLHHFSWCDDFAAARNYALERTTGDWVIFLDADEYLTEETRGNLRSTIRKYGEHDGLLFPMVHVDEDGAILGEDVVLRAFRKTPETRYRGRIHEEIIKGGQPLRKIHTLRKDELCLYHTGYAASISRRKAERNVRMLLEEMARDDEKTHYYHYLADAYYGLENEAEALRYARLDVALGPQPRTNPASSYRILLHYAKSAGEKRIILEQAIRDYPREASFHADFSETTAYLLDFPNAIQSMKKAISLYQKQGGMPKALHSLATMHILQWKSILAQAKSIRVSACCITKNAEQDIERWLEETAIYADERIVVDTGSTDGTLDALQREKESSEKARRSPLHIHRIVWQDDFAAAKNYALERATGEWIVFLDTDEYFKTPTLVRPYIAMMSLRDESPEAIHLPLINIDEDRGNQEIDRMFAIRILRRKDSIRYYGRLHEQPQKKGGEMDLYREQDRLPILHLGYSTGRMKRKLKRNFDILQKEIAEIGEQPHHWRYLAESWYGFGEYEKSLSYAIKALTEGAKSIGSESDMYRRAIASMHKLNRPLEEIQAFVEKAINVFPDLPDFYGELSIILMQRGKKEEALAAVRRAMSAAEVNSSKEASSFAAQKPILLALLEELEGASRAVKGDGTVETTEEIAARVNHLAKQLLVVLAERLVRGERLEDLRLEAQLLPENLKSLLPCIEEGALTASHGDAYRAMSSCVKEIGSPVLQERYQALEAREEEGA
ncbi:hypothetical protein TAMA11512_22260 [Selenomonas sp. TAMA-11512]|uniref:glycosyltransferase n=1 Tax=Selenomonas sp. TAMA-11512 TaxID=3095337 RepID=UPI003093DE23|nr:hypothetical protein TAMA11512_22260 [Selenomonas sp. TAMA-11512]